MTVQQTSLPQQVRTWLARFDRHRRRRRLPSPARLRQVLAIALFATATLLALQPGNANGEPTAPMLVAARDIAAGSTLRAADLRVVHAPASLRPDGVLTREGDAVGRVLAGAARTGQPLTDAGLVGRIGTRLPGDRDAAAVPVRLSDSDVADLLQPGATVDVITIDDGDERHRVLAREATVITVTAPEQARGLGTEKGRLVLIALPVESATRVASVSLHQPVTVTLRSP